MRVDRQDRPPRKKRIDGVGFSHETDHRIGTLPLKNPPESGDPANEPNNASKNRLAVDRHVERDQLALIRIRNLFFKQDKDRFADTQMHRQLRKNSFCAAIRHVRDEEHHFHQLDSMTTTRYDTVLFFVPCCWSLEEQASSDRTWLIFCWSGTRRSY